jgi:hypothetical protein
MAIHTWCRRRRSPSSFRTRPSSPETTSTNGASETRLWRRDTSAACATPPPTPRLAIDSMRNFGKAMPNNDAQVDFAIERVVGFCKPELATLEQMTDMFCKFLKDSPAQRDGPRATGHKACEPLSLKSDPRSRRRRRPTAPARAIRKGEERSVPCGRARLREGIEPRRAAEDRTRSDPW